MNKLKLIQGKIPFYILIVPTDSHNFEWDYNNDDDSKIEIIYNTYFFNEYSYIETDFEYPNQFEIWDIVSKLDDSKLKLLVDESYYTNSVQAGFGKLMFENKIFLDSNEEILVILKK